MEVQVLGPPCLGSGPSSTTQKLGDLRQTIYPFCALSSSSLKEEITTAPPPRVVGRIRWANIWKVLTTEPGTASQLL